MTDWDALEVIYECAIRLKFAGNAKALDHFQKLRLERAVDILEELSTSLAAEAVADYQPGVDDVVFDDPEFDADEPGNPAHLAQYPAPEGETDGGAV